MWEKYVFLMVLTIGSFCCGSQEFDVEITNKTDKKIQVYFINGTQEKHKKMGFAVLNPRGNGVAFGTFDPNQPFIWVLYMSGEEDSPKKEYLLTPALVKQMYGKTFSLQSHKPEVGQEKTIDIYVPELQQIMEPGKGTSSVVVQEEQKATLAGETQQTKAAPPLQISQWGLTGGNLVKENLIFQLEMEGEERELGTSSKDISPQETAERKQFDDIYVRFLDCIEKHDPKFVEIAREGEKLFPNFTTIHRRAWEYRLKDMKNIMELVELDNEFIQAFDQHDIGTMYDVYDDAYDIVEEKMRMQLIPSALAKRSNAIYEGFLKDMDTLIKKEIKRRERGGELKPTEAEPKQQAAPEEQAVVAKVDKKLPEPLAKIWENLKVHLSLYSGTNLPEKFQITHGIAAIDRLKNIEMGNFLTIFAQELEGIPESEKRNALIKAVDEAMPVFFSGQPLTIDDLEPITNLQVSLPYKGPTRTWISAWFKAHPEF